MTLPEMAPEQTKEHDELTGSGALVSRAMLLLASALLASCASDSPIHAETDVWLDPGTAAVEYGTMARLDWSPLPGVITLVDGKTAGAAYKQARLAPGRHTLAYAYYPAAFGAHPKGTIDIALTPGHSYEFRIKLCFWCAPRKYAVWVEDKTKGEAAWGKRPDWPAWYL